MNDKARAEAPRGNSTLWGSYPIAALLRALDVEFIALTPGASYRGLNDSLVNYLGNERPHMLLCIHEESAVRSPTATRASPAGGDPRRR